MTSPRAVLWRWRRLITATILALGAAFALAAIAPTQQATMLVAATSLPAGHVLTSEDLTTRPGPSVTDADPSFFDGGRLAIALDEGTPLTESMIVGPGLADDAPEGSVVAAVRLSTSPEMIPVGSIVDLYAPGQDRADLIASSATVLAFLGDDRGNLMKHNTVSETTEALLAISRNEAMLVLGISARTPVLAVLHTSHAS